jgi:hypothetical protein
VCRDARTAGEFATGRMWETSWKLDFLKRHISSKMHISSIQKLRNRNPGLRGGLVNMLFETSDEKDKRLAVLERRRAMPDEIKGLIDSVILAVKMNNSLLSVQEINEHLAKYVRIPESWRSKNYAFEFLDHINGVIQHDMMNEIASATRMSTHHSPIHMCTKCNFPYQLLHKINFMRTQTRKNLREH